MKTTSITFALLVLTGSCCVASTGTLRGRDLAAMEYQAVMAGPRMWCYYENGFDYVGYDLATVQAPLDMCCGKCMATPGCKTWSWTALNGGTCWLKSGRGDIVVNPAVTSAVLFYGSRPYCQLTHDMDYPGNDLANVASPTADGCCALCQKQPGCRAYTWSNHLGGTCWLKNKAGKAVYKPGVQAAEAYPDINDGCVFVTYGEDYVGNDLANYPSADHAGCCRLCRIEDGCRAYSWSNYNGGTCWLKSMRGVTVLKDGVVSSQLLPNPDMTCTVETDVDYVDNDLANTQYVDPKACCAICHGTVGCKAYTWSSYSGGTCWLKSAKGATVAKSGVQSGTI